MVLVPLAFTLFFLQRPRNRYRALPYVDSVNSVDARAAGTLWVRLDHPDREAVRAFLRMYFYADQYVQRPAEWRMVLCADSTLRPLLPLIRREARRRHIPLEVRIDGPCFRGGDSVFLIDRRGWIRGAYDVSSPLLVRRLRDDISMLYYEYTHPDRVVR